MSTATVSAAILRVLVATSEGKIERVSNGRGSKLQRPPGIGAKSIWNARDIGLIKDGPIARVAVRTTTPQILTFEGRAALAAAKTGGAS